MTYLRNIFKEQSFADISLSLDSLEVQIVWRPLPSWSTWQLRFPSGFPLRLQIEFGWVYTEYNYRALTVKKKKNAWHNFSHIYFGLEINVRVVAYYCISHLHIPLLGEGTFTVSLHFSNVTGGGGFQMLQLMLQVLVSRAASHAHPCLAASASQSDQDRNFS